jgi:hypothetical protein
MSTDMHCFCPYGLLENTRTHIDPTSWQASAELKTSQPVLLRCAGASQIKAHGMTTEAVSLLCLHHLSRVDDKLRTKVRHLTHLLFKAVGPLQVHPPNNAIFFYVSETNDRAFRP